MDLSSLFSTGSSVFYQPWIISEHFLLSKRKHAINGSTHYYHKLSNDRSKPEAAPVKNDIVFYIGAQKK